MVLTGFTSMFQDLLGAISTHGVLAEVAPTHLDLTVVEFQLEHSLHVWRCTSYTETCDRCIFIISSEHTVMYGLCEL